MASSADSDEKPRARGLQSIERAREARAKGKVWMPSPRFWAYSGVVLVVGLIVWWKLSQGELESMRQRLLADQRAVASEMAPRWLPLQRKVEGWTTTLGESSAEDFVDKEVLAKWDFRGRSGIYLRLPLPEASAVDRIRSGARRSLRDGFTSCLMRVPNPSGLAGKECKRTRDCPMHELCNEQDHCARPGQPFNLRMAYKYFNVLSDDWVREVRAADTELRLRLYAANFEDTVRDELPIAADLLTQAQYFLVVLDEIPDGMPADAGAIAEAIQGIRHYARIAAYRLSDGKLVLRLRRETSGELIGAAPTEPDVAAARQRQANSCSLALAVREAIGDVSAASVPPQ